jgi:predicted membrane-bound dolichyl-phosphate-mannose-protein mannosyltransferase
MRHSRPANFTTALLSVLALASVVFMGKSYESLLRGIDSNIHASAALNVTADGVKPRLPIPMRFYEAPGTPAPSKLDTSHYFNDHPFFGLWLNGLLMRALGPDAWSARLLTGLFSVGSVLLTFALGSLLYSRVFGMLAAVFLVFCRDFVLTSATMSLDTGLVFFILLTFWFWLRRKWVALGLAAGIGLWIKTPIVLLVFPTALIHDAIFRRLDRSFWKLTAAGILAVAVGSLMWLYAGLNGGWEMVQDYWQRQLWGTAVGGRNSGQGTDWGFFFYYVRTGFLPGLPFLLIGLVQIYRRRLWATRAFVVPALATGIVAAVVTAMRFKLGHYVTPVFPFLALISAFSLVKWLEKHEARFYAAITGFAILVMAVLLISPISLGPEAFVALKRFIPLIQVNAQCAEHIALVPGGEPVGSALDYRLALDFYTGRKIQVVECAKLAEELRSSQPPEWIILSHENFLACLPAAERLRFTGNFLVGTQHLLTNRIKTAEVVDLTPLEVELKAVRDCVAPPYPRDRWHRYLE